MSIDWVEFICAMYQDNRMYSRSIMSARRFKRKARCQNFFSSSKIAASLKGLGTNPLAPCSLAQA